MTFHITGGLPNMQAQLTQKSALISDFCKRDLLVHMSYVND